MVWTVVARVWWGLAGGRLLLSLLCAAAGLGLPFWGNTSCWGSGQEHENAAESAFMGPGWVVGGGEGQGREAG